MNPTVCFDVRPLLTQGQDPLDAILAAWAALPAGSRLAISAPFEPRPLAALFSAQGLPVMPQQSGPQDHWLFIGPKPC
jgi:hypothetical protein